MEILVTIAYLFLIRLVFFDLKWLKFDLVWSLLCSGLYASAALVEVVFLGQLTPYSESAFVQKYVVQIGPEFGDPVDEVHVKRDEKVKQGDPLFSLDTDTFQATVDEDQANLVLAKQNIKVMRAQLKFAQASVAHQESLLQQAAVQVEISSAAVLAAQAQQKFDVDETARQTKLAEEGAGRRDVAERARQTAAVSSELVIEAQKQFKEDQLIASDRSELDVAKATAEEAELSLDAIIDGEHATVKVAKAKLAQSTTRLKNRTVLAPSDGQILNLQLQPSFILLKEQQAAIYTVDAADILKVLRKIEIRSESFLNYVYNPFRG